MSKEIDNFFEEKLAEVQKQKLTSEKPKKKKSRKGIVIAAIALILAGITAITAAIAFRKKKDKPEDVIPPTTITMGVDDLGKEEEFPKKEENKGFGNTTGDIKKEDLVVKDDTIWKDKEAADKKDEIGKTDLDLQDGKLEKDENGDVIVKGEEDYIVKDENGDEKETGTNENGVPEGYSWDSVLNKYVKTEDVGKYVLVDATYYGPDGSVVYEKGEVVLKETLEKIKSQLSTTKPTVPETTVPEITVPETTVPETTTPETTPETTTPEVSLPGGVVNADGTFTLTYEIDGEVTSVTFMDKATYEMWLLDENSDINYGMYNGIIYPISVIEEMTNQKSK